MEQIKVRKPKFQQYEKVFKDWNGQSIETVVRRWYNIDKDEWWYGLRNRDDEKLIPEWGLDHIIDDRLWGGTMSELKYIKKYIPEKYQEWLSSPTISEGLKDGSFC